MSKFQIILTTVFSACILIGLVLFAMSKNESSTLAAHLTVWGGITQEQFDAAVGASTLAANKNLTFTYVRKDPTAFDTDFIEALASGQGPDIIILRDDSLYKHRNKIFTIPYKNYSERTFKDVFVEQGELNLTTEGVRALPFMVDPMVMYWNRDLFTGNLLAQPPQYWDEFYSSTATSSLIDTLTRKDFNANITQSALALGEWKNVTNAKEILVMLMLQAGTPLVADYGQGYTSVLNGSFDRPIQPSFAATNFYTQFSNPTSPTYTWNRSLPNSQVFFLSGKLATYLGFASELFSIQEKNPNLNFDVTYVPQTRNTPQKTGFAHMHSLAIVKQSQNVGAAFVAINALTEVSALSALGALTSLPPVRRDMLAQKPSDAYRTVFYNSALLSQGWIDPDKAGSEKVFKDMIESITSGRVRTSDALLKASDQLNTLLR